MRRLWLWLAVFAMIYATAALSQEGYRGKGHEQWHESFYAPLMRPDTPGYSCCNLNDCRPTSGRVVDNHYEVKVNGVWVAVLRKKIVRRTAPDHGFHVCAPDGIYLGDAYNPERLYCVIVPPEG